MTAKPAAQAETTVFAVLFAGAFCHLLNDLMQSLLPALYPQLKDQFGLSFAQVGLVTLAYQTTGSLSDPGPSSPGPSSSRKLADSTPRPFGLSGRSCLSGSDTNASWCRQG